MVLTSDIWLQTSWAGPAESMSLYLHTQQLTDDWSQHFLFLTLSKKNVNHIMSFFKTKSIPLDKVKCMLLNAEYEAGFPILTYNRLFVTLNYYPLPPPYFENRVIASLYKVCTEKVQPLLI